MTAGIYRRYAYMKQKTTTFIKQWLIPPALQRVLRDICGAVTWSGNYSSWEEACAASTGYDSKAIMEKVQEATLKVKSGQAACERDSVLFDEIQYSWPLLAGLMWIAAINKGELNVIDYGGSLGSTYFQNRAFLQSLSRVQWNIVEQKHFVDVGKEFFEDSNLQFYYDIDGCMRGCSPNAILFSSVLQYLEKPYSLLEKCKVMGFEFILLDRTPFVPCGGDRLAVQKVPPAIYSGSYPCWFFDKGRLHEFFGREYRVVAEFDSLLDSTGVEATFEGCIFRRR